MQGATGLLESFFCNKVSTRFPYIYYPGIYLAPVRDLVRLLAGCEDLYPDVCKSYQHTSLDIMENRPHLPCHFRTPVELLQGCSRRRVGCSSNAVIRYFSQC
jgi:hypothetical protein